MPRALRHGLCPLLVVLASCQGAGAPDDLAVAASALTAPGQITLSTPVVPAAGTFEVTVTDADANVDPASVDAVHVYVKSGTCSELVRFSFVETGNDTGVFRRTISTARASCDPSNDTIEVSYGDTLTVVYRDPNASVGQGSCGSAIVTANAPVESQLPDLTVDSVTVTPEVRYAGASITVSAKIRNVLGGPAVGSTSRAVAVLGYWDTSDYPTIFETIATIGDVEVQNLAADATQTVTFPPYVLNDDWNGNFVIQVIVDPTWTVQERNESNNARLLDINVLGPDLTVESLSVTPAAPVSGGTITVTAVTRNLPGGPAANPSTTMALLGAWDRSELPYVWDVLAPIRADSVPELGANQAHDFPPSTYAIPSNFCGQYSIGVFADYSNVVGERNEGNNAAMLDLTIVGPNLVPSISVTPTSVARGAQIVVSGDTRNEYLEPPAGTPVGAPVAAPSTTRVVLGYMDTSDYPDMFVELVQIGTDAVPQLNNGATPDGYSFTYTIPSNLTPGTYILEVHADSGNAVCERSEANARSVAFTVL